MLRPIRITRSFTQTPAGSVLWQQGNTVVFCTTSVTPGVPPWFKPDQPGGWITAEYVMLPGSTPQRKAWPKTGHTDSRGTEIQRLIGRALRGVIDLSRIGPHTLAVDCQVLQADGGTRTACISAAYVSLCDALAKLPRELPAPAPNAKFDPRVVNKDYNPAQALTDQLAAVSVGIVNGQVELDLDYIKDSNASVDMNVAYTKSGKFVEIQAAAENGQGFDRVAVNQMLDAAVKGCEEIMAIQTESLQAK